MGSDGHELPRKSHMLSNEMLVEALKSCMCCKNWAARRFWGQPNHFWLRLPQHCKLWTCWG